MSKMWKKICGNMEGSAYGYRKIAYEFSQTQALNRLSPIQHGVVVKWATLVVGAVLGFGACALLLRHKSTSGCPPPAGGATPTLAITGGGFFKNPVKERLPYL